MPLKILWRLIVWLIGNGLKSWVCKTTLLSFAIPKHDSPVGPKAGSGWHGCCVPSGLPHAELYWHWRLCDLTASYWERRAPSVRRLFDVPLPCTEALAWVDGRHLLGCSWPTYCSLIKACPQKIALVFLMFSFHQHSVETLLGCWDIGGFDEPHWGTPQRPIFISESYSK